MYIEIIMLGVGLGCILSNIIEYLQDKMYPIADDEIIDYLKHNTKNDGKIVYVDVSDMTKRQCKYYMDNLKKFNGITYRNKNRSKDL